MAWCLTKEFADKFRAALKDGTIDPVAMADMTSAERREFLTEFVGEENAQQINALFESKLLLKNQQAGMITWAKKVAGITPTVRRDLLSRIERMDRVLDPAEGEQFLADLAAARLKIEVTQEEAKNIMDMSRAVSESRDVWVEELNKHPTWSTDSLKTKNQWFTNEKRMQYGANKVALESYINDLKLEAKKLTFKEDPLKKSLKLTTDIPAASKSLLSALDNSLWGRQGIPVLMNPKTTGLWVRNFMKSWNDIKKELNGQDAMLLTKADIYSRPNAVNGKYAAGRYGLDVLSEEAFPSSVPEKIPAFRRLFRASESAYNGGALRLRADLADRYITIAEKQGLNMLSKEDAVPIGNMIGSMTGRGNLGRFEAVGRELNVLLFSAKLLKARFDILTAHQLDPKATPFVKREAAKNLFGMVVSIASLLAIANLLDPESVDEDPRSTNFGKIKIWGHWVDITGGIAGMLTLASRLIPTTHEGEWGFWYKTSSGNYIKLSTQKYGSMTALDVFESYFEGKLSPAAGLLRDLWKGEDFDGNPITLVSAVKGMVIPIPLDNMKSIIQDPNSSFPLGSIILDSMGFSTSTSIIPNKTSQIIPENTKVTEGDIISYVNTYATAMNVDPETAFKRIFTGEKIVRVTGNTVIVERLPVDESQEIKEKAGAKNPTMKLDHTIPLQLGGSNDIDNLKLVTTSEHSKYTTVENALGRALKSGKVTKKEAQTLIIEFKEGKKTKEQVMEAIE